MFRFGKAPKDPLADAKTAERWLASFPASDPLAVHSALLIELRALTELSTNIEKNRTGNYKQEYASCG